MVTEKNLIPANVGVVLVTYNSAKYISECLRSLQLSQQIVRQKYEVVLVDNFSNDNTVALVSRLFPWVKLIANKENRGFSAGNNQGFESISTQYILFLNPDTVVLPGSIEKMMNYLKNSSGVGAVGALLLNEKHLFGHRERSYYRKYPSIIQAILFDSVLNKFTFRFEFIKRKLFYEIINIKNATSVMQLPGACIFARRDDISILGGWDEDFPLYFEDVDLCYRFNKKNLKMVVLPSAKILHMGGASVSGLKHMQNKLQFYSSEKIFFRKHYGFIWSIIFFFAIMFLSCIYYFYQKILYLAKGNDKRNVVASETMRFMRLWLKEISNDVAWINEEFLEA